MATNQSLAPGSNPEIFINLQKVNKELLKAEINIKDSESILGAAFHLHYDPTVLQYQNYEAGDFFGKQSQPVYLVTNKDDKIYFGVTLRKDDVLASGEGSVVNFYFKPMAEQETVLSFSNTVLSTFAEQRINLNAEWQSATFQANSFLPLHWAWSFILIPVLLLAALFIYKRKDRIKFTI